MGTDRLFIIGSPPLARGKPPLKNLYLPQKGITPACAGKTFPYGDISQNLRDHPRLRGENDTMLRSFSIKSGSPPLARGKPGGTVNKELKQRITPACAGKTNQNAHNHGWAEDHPRLRGENCACWGQQTNRLGSPPLARGKLCKFYIDIPLIRITPACAGKTKAFKTVCL